MAMERAAVCLAPGVEMAQPLFRQKKMHGDFQTPAKFMPTWNSPVEVAPSPKKVTAISSRLNLLPEPVGYSTNRSSP